MDPKIPVPDDLLPYNPSELEREFMLLVLIASRKTRKRREIGNAAKDLQEFFDVVFKSGYAVVPRGLIDAMAKFIFEQRRHHAN